MDKRQGAVQRVNEDTDGEEAVRTAEGSKTKRGSVFAQTLYSQGVTVCFILYFIVKFDSQSVGLSPCVA